jgi:hypothetical protein
MAFVGICLEYCIVFPKAEMAEETGSSRIVPNYNRKVETGIVKRKTMRAKTFLVVRAKKAGGRRRRLERCMDL